MDIKKLEAKKESVRGGYILVALEQYSLNGDAYVQADEVYSLSKRVKQTSFAEFQEDFRFLIREGRICREGSRVYLKDTLRYEESAAKGLASILKSNAMPCPSLPSVITVKGGLPLCDEQREAVRLALSCRLSVILGGAGSGKSTLIRAITEHMPAQGGQVLCAPTGKAARNLEDRTGMIVRTVHSALGVIPDADFLTPVCWPNIGLVIVDEASMMTIGMLAGILDRVASTCRVVLIGDPNQLLSVGSGNVLPNLLRLGIPHILLERNHRLRAGASELLANVAGFSSLHTSDDFVFGESFSLRCMSESCIKQAIVEEAVVRYRAGESVQVLSPYNSATELSVLKLNQAIHELVNPATPEKLSFGERFRDGDKVIILTNDRDRNCSNGDVGVLRIISNDKKNTRFYVQLPDGRCPTWDYYGGLTNIALAYALTVHKSQGSEYDTILMPIADSFNNMLHRNLLYTAISRARSKVVLYGSRNALSVAAQKPARERRSQLVAKCGMASVMCA